MVVLIPRGLGFCTDGTNSLVKKKKGGEPLKLNTAHDRRSKVSEPCLFATWDCVPSGTFVSFVEVSFVDFPNWSGEGDRRHGREGTVGAIHGGSGAQGAAAPGARAGAGRRKRHARVQTEVVVRHCYLPSWDVAAGDVKPGPLTEERGRAREEEDHGERLQDGARRGPRCGPPSRIGGSGRRRRQAMEGGEQDNKRGGLSERDVGRRAVGGRRAWSGEETPSPLPLSLGGPPSRRSCQANPRVGARCTLRGFDGSANALGRDARRDCRAAAPQCAARRDGRVDTGRRGVRELRQTQS